MARGTIRAFRNDRSLDSAAPTGFTLLEVVVTLVLIGLAAALVAPSLRSDTGPRDEFADVVAQSRELAVRRAQTLVLAIDTQGRWRLTTVDDTASIGLGTIEAGAQMLRISPLGVCFTEGAPAPGLWDAIACSRITEGVR